ncbi:hypothetical protein LSAT2_021675 [Lamellibrachia satsuma]|nr:hypothetical protein LSAT2_021675 [Lamellibrachia satsuma]
MFLHEEHQLRALRFLPSIVKLQRILLERYERKIDKAEANNLKVSDFLESLQDDHAREEHMTLVNHFGQAWYLLREAIAKVGFGGIQVPKEFCEETVSREMSLAMLLPAVKGLGVCSFALLQYLVTMQNNFMEEYSRLSKQSCEECVLVQDVTRAHLVSYHPERDLLPVVLSCCQYSLHVGKGSAITYDFVTLERQIVDRFIRNRPRLDPQMGLVAFREDFTSASIFTNLDKHIAQESLGLVEQHRIRNEMCHLTDLTNSLANLDIAIGFLVSVGGQPETLLVKFMTDTLGMPASIHSQQARQLCCLKHVKSLWLLLSHERAKRLTRHGQDAFDNIDEKYRETVPEEQLQQLDAMLRHINVDPLLSGLYECSLLHITVKQDTNAEDYADNQDQPLGYLVDSYLDTTDALSIPVLTNGRFPADILAKHCLDTWRHIVLYASRLQHLGK